MQVIRASRPHTFLAIWGQAFPQADIADVGYTILNADGNVLQARQNPEVSFGLNHFGVAIEWPESIAAYVRWDIDEDPATHIHEEFYVLKSDYVGLTFEQIPRTFVTMFPPAFVPTVDVGYTILNRTGTPVTPRTTLNVIALGNGKWGTNLTFMSEMTGYIKWDIDGDPAKIAMEEFTVLKRPPDLPLTVPFQFKTVQVAKSKLTVLEHTPAGVSRVITEHFYTIDTEGG